MTNPRVPNPTPSPGAPGPRLRPSDERAMIAAAGRTTRRIALVALALGVVALGFAAWRTLLPSSSASCQTTAWNATPAADQIPAGWTLKGTTYENFRKTLSLVGPQPADSSTSQAVIYATVTCYVDGASDAVTRSAAAATAAGQTVTDRPDLGDQAYQAVDASNATFIELRHGSVVVDLAATGSATQAEVDQLASAFDQSLGGDGGNIASPGPSTPAASGDGSSAAPSVAPSGSPAAPGLEKALPTQVGSVALTVESAVGSTILGTDQGSRAITAALRAEGKSPDALKVAQAYDATGTSDLTLMAISVDGMPIAKVKGLVMDSWLAASGAGVTTSTVTMSGHEFTKVDYGDEGAMDYVLTDPDKVIVITTSDPAVAAQAAAALP
jgi:hypothetical protein